MLSPPAPAATTTDTSDALAGTAQVDSAPGDTVTVHELTQAGAADAGADSASTPTATAETPTKGKSRDFNKGRAPSTKGAVQEPYRRIGARPGLAADPPAPKWGRSDVRARPASRLYRPAPGPGGSCGIPAARTVM
ncbi:hypothetical protein GCM10025881_29820 [Pseudolysinimonas kribbensis]|uniref:Uncharacterized protein n=1 Tax=Pseudolysinimonas kribbensis TaxID=433641 RepID=A0ABQ6K6T6_9MICO|nr:hypothetical protein GCM10025881_29820 [Pseudolysinimonas kribbensis]